MVVEKLVLCLTVLAVFQQIDRYGFAYILN